MYHLHDGLHLFVDSLLPLVGTSVSLLIARSARSFAVIDGIYSRVFSRSRLLDLIDVLADRLADLAREDLVAVEVRRLVLEQELVRAHHLSAIPHVVLPLLLAAIFRKEAEHDLGTAHLIPVIIVQAVLDLTSLDLIGTAWQRLLRFLHLVALERIIHLVL